VHVYIPSVSAVLAELAAERLAAVRALALECLTAAEPDPALARPGEPIERQLAGYTIRTGTPLGGADDPRRRYQTLYHEIATAVKEPARQAAAAAAPGRLQQLIAQIRQWAEAARLDFEPFEPLAQPLGNDKSADSKACYDLAGLLRLSFSRETGDLVRLQAESLSETGLRLQLSDDGEIIQTALLENAHDRVELLIDVSRSHELTLSDNAGGRRIVIPFDAIAMDR
jgi:hypothetical protein